MRVFLALEMPDSVKEYLTGISRSMAQRIPGVKWVKAEGQHVTLKFFGEIDSARVREIEDALAGLGSKYSPVKAGLKRIDAFPDLKRARVVVVAFEEGVDNVKAIFHDIERRLTGVGVEMEKREFIPHITLGRMKTPALLLGKDIPTLEEMSFVADTLVLYESTLTSGGALYAPLKEITLEKNC